MTEGDGVTEAMRVIAQVAEEHEVVIAYCGGLPDGLELALRNALPERDVVTVPIDVVVESGDRLSRNGTPVLAPQAIVELRSLRTLIDSGVLVGCAVGAGVPVTLDGEGTMLSVEANVDESLTASLLARRLDADVLVLLADAGAGRGGRGGGNEQALRRVTPAELRQHGFAAGSAAAAEAACRFVEATGRRSAIGDFDSAVEIVRGKSGTQISP